MRLDGDLSHTESHHFAAAPELDGLELVVDCEAHAFRHWARPGAKAPRECPACRRELEGLSAAERRAARRRDFSDRAFGRAQDPTPMT